MEEIIKTIDGEPMVSTITIAAICRNGKSNNVYRMAKRLSELGVKGIIVHSEIPAHCMLNKEAFTVLAKRFWRKEYINTAEQVEKINKAFQDWGEQDAEDEEPVQQDTDPTEEASDINETSSSQDEETQSPQPSYPRSFEWDVLQTCRITFESLFAEIENCLIRLEEANQELQTMYNDKKDECDAVRAELEALRNMVVPMEEPKRIQPLNGNVSVQQCAAWLTSQGVKDIGMNRLYEWMRQHGLVCKTGKSRNLPTQIALDKCLLVSESNPYTHPKTGERMNSYTTRVTPKGQVYLYNRLMYNQINGK